jgi:hypothetical protein
VERVTRVPILSGTDSGQPPAVYGTVSHPVSL